MRYMNRIGLFIATIVSIGATVAPALGQNGAHREAQVDRVQENQQDRIGQGVTSGSLTAGEAARLERNQASIERQSSRLASDGRFTRHDQRLIDRRQDHQNRAIYRFKHNGRHA